MSGLVNISDEEIIHGIQNGNDDKVLSMLYAEILPNVERFICKNNGSVDEAHDIFQDAIVIFYKQVKLNKFDEKYKIAGFLFSVSRNLWINRAKKLQRHVELTDNESHFDVDRSVLDDLITDERENLINKLLEEIGENCKEILMYSVYKKLSMKEICKLMGYSSENTAKTRNYKCKQRLIKLVQNNQFLKEELKA